MRIDTAPTAPEPDARHPGLTGIDAQHEATPQWVVRFTWEVVSGLAFPKHTYSKYESESRAKDAAKYMIDNYDQRGAVRLVGARVKGPDGQWIKVE